MSAAMGNTPPVPSTPPRATREFWNSIGLGSRGTPETQLSIDGPPVLPPAPPPTSPPAATSDARSLMNALDIGLTRRMFESPFGAGNLRPQASPPPGAPRTGNFNYAGDLPTQRLPQTQAAVSVPGMGLGPYGMTPPPPSVFFDNANPGPTFTQPGAMTSNVSIPKSPFEGSTGAGFTPPMPSPPKPPSISQAMRDQFDVAFAPGASGQIMDLQTAFNNRFGQPPTMMTGQDRINAFAGVPPAAATPSNLALPFSEVTGFDANRFAGPSPANAANVTSPLPKPPSTTWGDMSNIEARLDDAAGPKPGPTRVTQPTNSGVADQVEQPIDIRPAEQIAMTGPPRVMSQSPMPAQTQQPAPQISLFPGLLGRALNAAFPGLFPNAGQGRGPIGGGILGMLAARNPPIFTPGGRSGVGINSSTGGPAAYQHGTVGNMGAMQYVDSSGRLITVAEDPFQPGHTMTGYS